MGSTGLCPAFRHVAVARFIPSLLFLLFLLRKEAAASPRPNVKQALKLKPNVVRTVPETCDDWTALRTQYENDATCFGGDVSCCKLYDDMYKAILVLRDKCVISNQEFYSSLFQKYCSGSNVPPTTLPPTTTVFTTTVSQTDSVVTTTHSGSGGGNGQCQPCNCATCSDCVNGCVVYTTPPCPDCNPCSTCAPSTPPPTTAPPPCSTCPPPPCTTNCNQPCPQGCSCTDYKCSCTGQRCDPGGGTTNDGSGGTTNNAGTPVNTQGECLHGDGIVELSSGVSKRVRELQVGDKVQIGASSFSTVFMFTHRDPSVTADFVRITTHANQSVVVTHSHYIHTARRLLKASDVRVDDFAILADGSPIRIASVTSLKSIGIYNPQTTHGNIVVDGLLISTYTGCFDTPVAHSLLSPLRALYRICGLHVSSLF